MTVTMLTVIPTTYPMLKVPLCRVLRRINTFVRIGRMYARLLIVTADPRRALKAVDDPR